LAAYDLDPSEWVAVLMTASGTAAIESMLTALVPATGRVLVVENGVYGARIAEICIRYGIGCACVVGSWLDAPDLTLIAACLDAAEPGQPFTHLAVVHHETTTGRLNELRAIASICRMRGVHLLVDAVSSFGAEAIDFDDPSLTAVAASANKCLHGVPGAAFVLTRRRALASAVCRSYYLDLRRLAKLQDQRDTPFTPAVHVYYGLREALREYEEEGGRVARRARYLALAEQVRRGLFSLGIETVLPVQVSSVVLRAYHLPDGIGYAQVHAAAKSGGFVVYAGQSGLSNTLFRIATMGAVTAPDIDRLVDCFASFAPSARRNDRRADA
jgi:2-aminoethylphosphonate-pyruvate transaminase